MALGEVAHWARAARLRRPASGLHAASKLSRFAAVQVRSLDAF